MTDTLRILAALETVWDALRERHPDLPAVRVAIDKTGARHDLVYPEDHITSDRRPELAVSADTIRKGGRAVIEHLLHVATHALADARGVSATSNRGRRHNQKFAAMATFVGGHWPDGQSPHPVKGYSPVPVREDTWTELEPYVSAVDTVLATANDLSELSAPAGRGSSRLILACQCPRKIQVGKRVAAQGPIICGVCESEFTEA